MDNSIIRDCIHMNYLLQLSTYYSEIIKLNNTFFAFSKNVAHSWYNHAYEINEKSKTNAQLNIDLIIRNEKVFHDRNRVPAFYFTPSLMPYDYNTKIQQIGYTLFDNEAWMFFSYDKSKMKCNDTIEVKEVDRCLFDIYISFFRRNFKMPEVEGYINGIVHGFYSSPPFVTIKHYMGFYKNYPVGILSLHTIGKYAGLYAGIVSEENQGTRVCSTMVYKAIHECKKNNIEYIFLQTEEENKTPFQKMGFATEFDRMCYIKK